MFVQHRGCSDQHGIVDEKVLSMTRLTSPECRRSRSLSLFAFALAAFAIAIAIGRAGLARQLRARAGDRSGSGEVDCDVDSRSELMRAWWAVGKRLLRQRPSNVAAAK